MSAGLYHCKIPDTPLLRSTPGPRDARTSRAGLVNASNWRLTWNQIALLAILAVAAVLRLWSIQSGVPYAVGADEATIVERSLRILNTGDWNPHVFDYPTLVIYLHAAVAILRFMAGASRAEWASLAQLDIGQVYVASRFISALIGTATVWLTYRVGRDAGSERIALLGAAGLALLPLHVRDSQVVIADGPATALTTLTVYLSMRGDTVRSWWAGVSAGLAMAARYAAGLALVAVIVAAIVRRDTLANRVRALGMAIGAAAAAFLIASPYTLLDLPAFLNSFAGHTTRLASGELAPVARDFRPASELAAQSRVWLLYAVMGAGVIVSRRQMRARWLPALAFGLVYAYMLARPSAASPSTALPLTPIVCLFAAAGIDALARLAASVPGFRRPRMRAAAIALLVLPMAVPFVLGLRDRQHQVTRHETRQVAAEWLKAGVPRGTRVAVERGGPTHLSSAGFDILEMEQLTDHSVEWYAERKIEYLVVSSGGAWNGGYADAGAKAADIPSTPQRPGPAIRIVRIGQ